MLARQLHGPAGDLPVGLGAAIASQIDWTGIVGASLIGGLERGLPLGEQALQVEERVLVRKLGRGRVELRLAR